MKKFFVLLLLGLTAACTAVTTDSPQEEVLYFNPDFNKYAQNVTVVKADAVEVVYEYKNIRVDELAALAALYCQEQNDRRARLYEITLHKNNARRATFVCENY